METLISTEAAHGIIVSSATKKSASLSTRFRQPKPRIASPLLVIPSAAKNPRFCFACAFAFDC
jgi:hypothetical protein